MRLATLLVFGAGYVIGTRAGDERYAQIVAVAESASKRLEQYSDHHRVGDDESERASRRRKAVL